MANKITLEAIESSNLAAIGYDDKRHILAVQFKNSAHIIHYAGVAPATMLAFYQAESRGKFYGKEIRGNKAYQAQQMTGECPDCGDVGWIEETCGDCGCSTYKPVQRKERRTA